MSTRSRIGILQKDLTVKSVYHHWDGYPEWLGVTLEKQYNTEEKVAKLIDGGNMSSCWSDNQYDEEKQEYVKNDPRPEYYGGDDERPHNNESIQDFLKDANMSEEFLYLFTSEGWRAWSVRPQYDKDYNVLNTDTTPVKIPAWDVADDS